MYRSLLLAGVLTVGGGGPAHAQAPLDVGAWLGEWAASPEALEGTAVVVQGRVERVAPREDHQRLVLRAQPLLSGEAPLVVVDLAPPNLALTPGRCWRIFGTATVPVRNTQVVLGQEVEYVFPHVAADRVEPVSPNRATVTGCDRPRP